MNNYISTTQVYSEAMRWGLYLGNFFIIKFVVTLMGESYVVANLVSLFLTLSIPWVVYRLMLLFQKRSTLSIRFTQMWLFGILLYIFGGLLVGITQYFYYEYVDSEFLATQMESARSLMGNLVGIMEGVNKEQGISALAKEMADMPTPSSIEMVIQTIWTNTFLGSILTLLLTPLVRSRRVL